MIFWIPCFVRQKNIVLIFRLMALKIIWTAKIKGSVKWSLEILSCKIKTQFQLWLSNNIKTYFPLWKWCCFELQNLIVVWQTIILPVITNMISPDITSFKNAFDKQNNSVSYDKNPTILFDKMFCVNQHNSIILWDIKCLDKSLWM